LASIWRWISLQARSNRLLESASTPPLHIESGRRSGKQGGSQRNPSQPDIFAIVALKQEHISGSDLF
jgi:hypothetical protein